MNKIYKIVWSKIKNTYVVVSEVAKSHSKSGQVRGRVTLAAAVLGVLMATALPTFGVYAATDIHYVSIKSDNQTADSNYDNQGAQAENSIAIGVMNISKGESSSAIGTKNKAEGEKSSSFGYLNIATGKQSSALGFRNYATAENSAAIGIYNNKYNVVKRKWEDQTAGDYSVAIGAKNHSAGNYSSALGYENMSAGSSSSAVGYRNITDADQAAALGYSNQATGQYSSATGALNQASGRYSSAIGGANQAQGTRSQALGYRNFVSGYGAVSIGSENNLNFVKQYQALGFVQTGDLSSALGISNTTAGRKSMGIGSSNYAFGTKSAGIGMNNYSMGYETLAIGHYAVAGSKDPSKIDQVKYAAAIGNRAKSTITDAVAIGSFSNTTRDKGDYGYNPVLEKAVTDTDITDDANIGTYRTELENARAAWQTSMEKAEELLHKIHTQQYADEAEYQQWGAEYDRLNADADAKMAAYDAAQKKVGDLVGAWQGQMAALSVGDEKTGRTRQITGVAAGSADTDAVNVAQLKALSTKVDNGGVHYLSVKGESQDADSNYKNDGAKGKGAVAIGEKALAYKGGTVSIGRNAHILGNGGNTDGEGSVAIGDNALITTNGLDLASIALGKNAKVLNGSGKQERGLSFTPDNFDKPGFFGSGNTLPKNADKVPGGIAIGTNSYARTGSIQLGHHTFDGYKMGGIDVTKANEEANIVGMTTVGTNTYNKGALANMYGAYSIITGNFTGEGGPNSLTYGPQNFGANVVGSLNSIRSKGHSGSSGVANSIVGVANTVENANGTLVYGAGNKITNSIKSISAEAGFKTLKSWEDAVTGLQKVIKNSKSGGAVLAIGGGNVADYVRHSQLVGVNNTVTGTENKVSEFNMVNGYQNTATNITHVTMIGSDNEVKDTTGAVLLGDKRKLTGANGSIVLGSANESAETNVKDATVIGHNANTTVAGGVALGAEAKAITDKGIWGVDVSKNAAMTADALLGDKKAEYDAAKTKLQTLQEEEQNLAKLVDESQKNDPFNWTKNKELKEKWEEKQKEVAAQVIEVNNYVKTWQSTEAAVSVGDTDKGITRQITGVAAGSEDTDAVNVAQLKALSTKVDNGTVHYYSVTSDKKAAGSNFDNDGAEAADSMVIGIGSSSKGINSTVIGKNNTLTGTKHLRREGKEVEINNSIVAGHNLEVDGYCNSVLATDYEDDTFHGLTKVAGDYNTVLGAGNVVGYALKDKGKDYIYTKLDENIISNNNVVIGTRQTVSGSDNVVIGDLTTFEVGADQVTTIGIDNRIGSEAREGVAIGNHLGINGYQTVAIGFGSEANAESAIAFGSYSFAKAKNSLAIGQSSEAAVEGGVALGSGSIANREAGMAGYLAGSKTTAEWKSTLGALSVGVVSDEWTDTRQITGVAAGTKDTDAVNVAQLKAAAKNITDSFNDTTLQKGGKALSLDGTKLNLSVKDTAGNEVTGSVDLNAIKGAVDTNTYTTGGKYDAATKTIKFTRSDNATYDVDLSDVVSNVTGDTRNTIDTNSDTINVDATNKNADGSINYKLNVKTNGKVEKDNKGIVTGGIVYKETRIEKDGNYIKAGNTAGQNLIVLDKQVGANTTNITKLGNSINALGNRVDRVGAGAAALAALHPLDFDPDDKWDFAAGYGNYKGANAAAIGAYYRPNEDTMFSVGGSFGGGENMVNAGVSVKLGQGNHVSTSKVAMAKDMLAMQKRMAEMEAQMAKMQGFIGALTGMDTQAAMFPDVPENHWAYEYVKGLCEKGIIEGYPDGNFNGNRSMTRYEFAAMLYRALAKGVNLDARAVKEFAPELGRIRVDVISQNKEGQPVIERVRVNEEKKDK